MSVEEKTVSEPEQKPKPKTLLQVECEIFALAVVGGDGNGTIVYDRLRGLTGKQRLHLRRSISWLDDLLDQVALDIHLDRSKSKSKGAKKV